MRPRRSLLLCSFVLVSFLVRLGRESWRLCALTSVELA